MCNDLHQANEQGNMHICKIALSIRWVVIHIIVAIILVHVVLWITYEVKESLALHWLPQLIGLSLCSSFLTLTKEIECNKSKSTCGTGQTVDLVYSTILFLGVYDYDYELSNLCWVSNVLSNDQRVRISELTLHITYGLSPSTNS